MAISPEDLRPNEIPGAIWADKLHVRFGQTEVLKGVTFGFVPGATTAIIGPSGCGKSTLIRTFNRLTELVSTARVSGSVSLDGEDIFELDPVDLRRQVGMVFQSPNPFPMSIRDNVLYGVKANRIKVNHDEIVEISLQRAGLWDEVKNRLKQSGMSLSLGQQQRLCIARALAVSPKVILMDEPSASLDPISTLHLEESIRAMSAEYTVIMVTHDMQQARRVAETTVFMLAGEIIEAGRTNEMFNSPKRAETEAYLSGHVVVAPQEISPEPVAQLLEAE